MRKWMFAIVGILGVGTLWWLWGDNLKLITGEVQFIGTAESRIEPSSASVGLSDILLFKAPTGEAGAIQFTRLPDASSADYKSWYLPSVTTSSKFNPTNLYRGHVFEKYWRTRIGKDEHFVSKIGGEYKLTCGPFALPWSAMTWVYFPKDWKVALVQSEKVEEIDLNSKAINWHNMQGARCSVPQ